MSDQAANQPVSSSKGLFSFFGLVGILFLARLAFGIASVPTAIAPALNICSAVFFIAVPIAALFSGASFKWGFPSALTALLVGVGLQVGSGLAVNQLHLVGVSQVATQALGQAGLLTWCLGLGVLVALLIKEKNLILPVAIFLAGFDVFLVLTPFAPTAAIVEQKPGLFQSVASTVPKARESTPGQAPKEAKLENLAFVGPADFLFSAVFFALLFRFKLRAKETALWLAPVLVAYMAVVLLPTGLGMLPALVPIGTTVLLVNRKEFELTKDEKQATWAVAVIAFALAAFGAYQRINYKPKPKSPAASSPVPADPSLPAPAAKP